MKKRHAFWNFILLLSVALCILAFAAHSRNWKKVEDGKLQVLSGFYYLDVPLTEVYELGWQEKVPYLHRSHGFSAGDWEKGVYRDSLRPDVKSYVLVDDWNQGKIHLSWGDSLQLFLNFRDSLETRAFYEELQQKISLQSNE
ncbi:hypothetical protein SAMN04490243_0927 [Robiginitalea myxolifaciens]|uniref:Uncharacterized protein n=1 Tax=Robiginitalea myxolifaciens TaxID=400055 RepID=A0A1I6FYP8_9FLAO|nr:hypothetical protein [Robiginitalea myxolifaciens]SFR35036.1 hypothetical protein SAMN04490243_0927 [Robiginitalea myxolifaciens]